MATRHAVGGCVSEWSDREPARWAHRLGVRPEPRSDVPLGGRPSTPIQPRRRVVSSRSPRGRERMRRTRGSVRTACDQSWTWAAVGVERRQERCVSSAALPATSRAPSVSGSLDRVRAWRSCLLAAVWMRVSAWRLLPQRRVSSLKTMQSRPPLLMW